MGKFVSCFSVNVRMQNENRDKEVKKMKITQEIENNTTKWTHTKIQENIKMHLRKGNIKKTSQNALKINN